MPIPYRTNPIPTVPAMQAGAAITPTNMNALQGHLDYLASRGGYSHCATALQVNGLTHPIVGVRGGQQKWRNDIQSASFLLPICAGWNSLSWLLQYKLNPLEPNQNNLGGYLGSQIKLFLSLNGVQRQIHADTWRETTTSPNQVKTIIGNTRIGDLFKLSPTEAALMSLVIVYDPIESTEIQGYRGQITTAPTFNNLTWYNGIRLFGFASYRDCGNC